MDNVRLCLAIDRVSCASQVRFIKKNLATAIMILYIPGPSSLDLSSHCIFVDCSLRLFMLSTF